MKLKKSAVKHLKQKAKKSLKSTGDASAAKQSRPKSRQGSSSRQSANSQMRRSEQLSHEDTTADSGFIKLKSPANKDSTGKRYIPYSL